MPNEKKTNGYFENIDPVREYDIYRRSQPEYHDIYIKGIPYMFMVTPRLNLDANNVKRDSFLMYLAANHKELFDALDINNKKTLSPFIRLLTNQFRGLNGKDAASRTMDIHETFYGYKQTLPISVIDSMVGDTVTINFEELKHLPVIKLIKAWFEYTEKVSRGTFAPSKDAFDKKYLDYTSAIYYFELDMDGKTILYWSKYTGVVPISVPYSSLIGDGKTHDIPDVSVEFIYSYKEDMNPAILSDFNKTALLDKSINYTLDTPSKGYIPYLNKDDKLPLNFTETMIKAKTPLIVSRKSKDKDSVTPDYLYQLKWFSN